MSGISYRYHPPSQWITMWSGDFSILDPTRTSHTRFTVTNLKGFWNRIFGTMLLTKQELPFGLARPVALISHLDLDFTSQPPFLLFVNHSVGLCWGSIIQVSCKPLMSLLLKNPFPTKDPHPHLDGRNSTSRIDSVSTINVPGSLAITGSVLSWSCQLHDHENWFYFQISSLLADNFPRLWYDLVAECVCSFPGFIGSSWRRRHLDPRSPGLRLYLVCHHPHRSLLSSCL